MPDPRHGVFETLLVIDGRAVEVDAHLERLDASLAELFPDHAAPDLVEMDVPAERASLRITVTPIGGQLEVHTSTRKPAHRFGPIALHSLTLPGGLGAHKWADRSLIDEAQAGLPAGALPLIVDEDGAALEASRANLFAVRDGALFTPPLDGRILPGVTRMRVLEIALTKGLPVEETELSIGDLLNADELFLTCSVRGIEPVESLDGASVRSGSEISDRLSAELQLAWTGAKTATLSASSGPR